MSNNSISALKLLSKNPAIFPEKAKDFTGTDFWQYTRLTTADLILSSSSFRVSNISGMNDLDESIRHERERERIFALCFCNSNTEKIPMWYLYSGIAGDGAAIKFTPGNMLNFIKSIKTVRGVRGQQNRDEGTVLTVGSDVEIQIGWVYYQKPQQPKSIMYRNKWYLIDDLDDFQKDNYFIKYYPWEYEKEFRIVFLNRTKENYDAFFVDIPSSIQKNLTVMLAPEIDDKKLKRIDELACIGLSKTHPPIYSNLSIRMDLFGRNRVGLIDYFSEEIKKKKPIIDAKTICKIVKDEHLCEFDSSMGT